MQNGVITAWCTCTMLFIVMNALTDAADYCSLSQFTCMNGLCIPLIWQCDEEDDCKDTSDELDCAPTVCNDTNEFRCASGHCIHNGWRCDGDPDCVDGSDEMNCTVIDCQENYFSCGLSKPCIPMSSKCDGHEDCANGHDESQEICNEDPGKCKVDEFMCANKNRCITSRWVCDLDNDCEDNSDEVNCGPANCSSTQFQCDSKQCVPMLWHCDGDSDCHDGSDERNCSTTQRPTVGSCSQDEFQCQSSSDCIHKAWQCDGEEDCKDASDEIGCKLRTCQADEFQCVTAGHCIPLRSRCNGIRECVDGSDEKTCPADTIACDLQTMFDCTNGKREHCISLNHVCDERNDCLGMEDEAPELCVNSSNSCLVNNGGCSHKCVFTYRSHFCSCPQGYQLSSDQLHCEDIDECLLPETCTQLCENKKGGYKCSCRAGYEWDQLDQSCRALDSYDSSSTSEEPFLLFANRHDLREIRLYSGHYNMLVEGLKSVIALDFDFAEKVLFWSDVATETISMTRLNGNQTRTVEVLVHHDVSTPDGLAFDWIHKNLYWTDTGNNRIDVLSLPASPDGQSMRKTLFNVNLDEPRAIVVDPRDDQRYIYWTDWGTQPKIERSCLDGSERTELITGNLQWPNGLTLDFEGNSLFWVDAKLHHIACSDLLGNNQRIVMTSYQHLKHPFAIAVFEDQVYWTDWETESIFKVHKFADKKGRSAVKNVAMQLFTPMDIHVYHKLKQPHATNACATNDCSHICLPKSVHLGGYSCHCPDHGATRYELDNSGKKCIPIPGKTGVATTSTISSTPMAPVRSRQVQRNAGQIAGVIVAILLIIAIAIVVFGVVAYRCFIQKTVRTLNFNNPVYRKTTEDHLSLEKHQHQPSRTLPPTLEPLTSADRECV